MDIKIINFQKHGDANAQLSVAEYKKELPFAVKRIYFLHKVKSSITRGKHCHKKLKQVYIAISGKMKIKLFDGRNNKTILLDNPNKGLYIGSNIWREIYDFSSNGILLVLASDIYKENDYIRSYNEYLKFIRGK